jgi:hypothetical protein
VRDQQNLYGVTTVLIEDKASGTQLIQELIADGIVNLSRGGMLPRSVARWFGAGKSLARL